jgi:hypothetical protein
VVSLGRINLRLHEKVAKSPEEDREQNEVKAAVDNPLVIPYSGLMGYIPNNLFYEPVDVARDPLQNTDDLPGEDGSEEKLAAIQKRIAERVESLREKGLWKNDGDDFGRDPLAKQPLWKTMAMQLKACRPFATWDELALTFVLVIGTILSLTAYLIFLTWFLEGAVNWYFRTDFDADYWPSLLHPLWNQFSAHLHLPTHLQLGMESIQQATPLPEIPRIIY